MSRQAPLRWLASQSATRTVPSTLRRTIFTVPPRASQAASLAACPEPEQGPVASGHDEFWRQIPMWRDVSVDQFTSYAWSKKNIVEHHKRSRSENLQGILRVVLPDSVPCDSSPNKLQRREELIEDVFQGIAASTMSLRLMPYIFSRINWQDPRHDPIFRQFFPVKSLMVPDHPKLKLDSLHENEDSPVDGVVHRYPDKALFLPVSVCPTYCTFCTRSYAVGAEVSTFTKQQMKPILKRWEHAFAYIESQPGLHDVVVSGGDAYYLAPDQLAYIGERLIKMKNIRKFRFASKGLAVCPNRVLDPEDRWADALIWVHRKALGAGKRMALHTHFNSPNEVSWITQAACSKLVEAGVTIRNQTVLLRGVNDSVETMSALIRTLADSLRVAPYYVYQCDMVKNTEHLRTPLQTMLDLETQIRGSIAGFDMPQFIVDLPEGGGKRLAPTFLSYDRQTGVSRYMAPAVKGKEKEDKVYEYYDPCIMA
ncbi:uncharacterized protein BCR38DRAFT_355489 [Pseudomassariella vexata]|uniref:L-lysine 2,3-aminomutase n=1 Tax=Pseudomassariella vexata TaxID=1141098 RepID=A0A1Y2DC19_9PEZI|nr:uncharacterized protein BCR38DRAFT_355489 [Pseudomassariella vexata]ORY56694.1 hypothetical protein BCR38DRAFT_355489 [Pseudomassariella vexata]